MATGQTIIDEVRRVIHDENPTYRWSDNELIEYINAGCRQTVSLVPKANTVETVMDLGTSRVARQALPAGGIKFIKVARNYADDGTTPQGNVRYVEKDVLDTYDPDWEYDTTLKADGANYFEHYCHDKSEPKVFFLYPPPAADNKRVAVVYSLIPTEIVNNTDVFPLDDEYLEAVTMYTIYRALTKEARETIPDAYRQELWQNYLAALGLQVQATEMASIQYRKPPQGD